VNGEGRGRARPHVFTPMGVSLRRWSMKEVSSFGSNGLVM
jgi:hypothetical protein